MASMTEAHKPYAAAVARLEAARERVITARSAADAARELYDFAQERWDRDTFHAKGEEEQLARRRAATERTASELADAEAELAEAARAAHELRATAEQRLGEQAQATYAKAVRRMGAAIRELLTADESARAIYAEIERATDGAAGRYLSAFPLGTPDGYGRNAVVDGLEGWLIAANAAGYKV